MCLVNYLFNVFMLVSNHSFQPRGSYLRIHSVWRNLHNIHCRHLGWLSGNLQDILAFGTKQEKGELYK